MHTKGYYTQAITRMKNARRMLVVSHMRPDADTLGAGLMLHHWLKGSGTEVTLACIDHIPYPFQALPDALCYVDAFTLTDYDLLVFVDAAASYMTGFHERYPELLSRSVYTINIDHHASNDQYGDLNIVETDAASATLILYRMCLAEQIEITKDMATCLLAGIYTDTGSFMHSNTTAEVYQAAGELYRRGAETKELIRRTFKERSVDTLRMWGRALEKATVTENEVVLSVVCEEDYASLGAQPEHCSGVIDYLNMVPGARFAALVVEDGKGNVKGSLRTRTDLDLSEIAAKFGGGGHPKASGFRVPGRLQSDVRYSIVNDDMSSQPLVF